MAGHRLTRQLEHLPSGPSHQPSGQQSSSLPQTPPQGRPASQSPDTLTHALPPKPSPQFPRATSYYRLQPITPLTEQEEADRQEFRDLRSLEDFEKQRGDELRLSRFEARLMKGGKGAIIYPSERPEYDRLRGLEWIQELRILRKRKEMRDNHQPGTPLSLPSLPKTPEPKPFVKPALPVKRKNSPVVIDNPHKSRLSNSRSSSAEPSTSDADTTTSSAATQASTPSPGRANQDTQVNTALAKSTAVQPAPGTPITLPVSPLLVTSGQAPTSKPISEPPTTSKPITEQAAIEEPIEEATPQPASTSEPPPRPERHLDLQDSILHGEALEHLLPSHQEVRAQLGREHWTGVTYDLWLDERMMRAIIVLELTRHGMSGEDPSKFDIGLVGPSWAYAWTQDRNRDDIRPPRGLAAAKKVLIPLCPRVNHWVLLCINKETNTATVYDALPSYVKNTAACVREFMLTFVPAFDLNIAGSIDIKHFGDGNGWDCGHSVLQCIQAFLNGMVPTASNDASIWQLEMLPQVLDFLTSIGVYDDEAPAPPLESQDDREVPLPENMAAYDFRDQDMQDNISEVGMTGYDVDPLEYDIPNDLLDFFDGDDADTSMHDATNHSSPARGDGHPCQNNNGNHDSDNDSDSDSDDNSIQGGTDNYSDDNGSNSDSDSDPDSDDPSNGERMRARELDEPEPNSEDEDEDADNFVASFNLDIAALNNDDDLDDEADGNIIGSFDWQAPVNGRNEKDDSEDSVDSDDAVSNASEDSLEDWNERTRYLPGRHFLKPIKAQQKSKWYNKEGKQVCGYPMFKTNGDYARAAFNKTWRHYNRIWAKNYLSLWAPSAEQMIASRDAGFDVSVDDDNMKCFTEYEKLRIRTGSPVAITQGKMFGPGTHTLRRLLLATGRLTPWEWECMTIRGHLLNISHLCNGGKSGCCNPWHLVIELRARNVSRSECFRHPENRSDPNREGRCRKHRIPCLQKTARFDWLHIANELYKEQSKKMLKEHYIQWNKKQISGRPKLANRNKQCPTCKRTFRKSGLLAKHVKTCGSTTERTQSTLECPICKRHFRGAGVTS
ncbi:hypothetical protein L207DRAFT_132003 [Hyaloscypha variabilis F]|uniref:Ubiquitin-like protease family profile domain-containing protein n=1 Tax=Hyaloscypha variabilis (strain UAMH 11265 / GT02V1 / F) TaxID=1149755 RepID=A0A2J6R643_HYAVF|nr:hypothetical protein L207DRAFT_132003 [Hyaloscypha variabilis F]